MNPNQIIQGDTLEVLKTWPDEFVDCCITSPPYWGLRDYGCEGQLGLEKTPEEYVAKMVEVFREVKRVLKKEGTCWLNLGDSYANEKVGNTETRIHKKAVQNTYKKGNSNLPHKNLVGIPWRVAFALQADGWYLRQDIIWHKPNPMPESVTDRCTKSHEYIFLLAKSQKYYFDNEAIKEPYTSPMNRWGGQKLVAKGESTWDKGTGQQSYRHRDMRPDPNGRNKRSVWTITTKPNPLRGVHFATFPEDLIIPMIKAGCPKDGIVLDPFIGSGTTAKVAKQLGRNYLGIELSPEYIKLANKRVSQEVFNF